MPAARKTFYSKLLHELGQDGGGIRSRNKELDTDGRAERQICSRRAA